jgi:alpha-mannosidase
VSVTVRGPLFVEVLARRSMKRQGYTTVFEQRVRLVDNDPVIYLDVDSDFHLLDSLVKLEFNTNLVTDTLAVDGPYLVLEKPTHPQTPAERARWEMACQKWIDLSEAELGLTLLNNGKYGFSLTADGKGFRQTIVKGARYPRANPGAYNVKHHYQSFPIPTGFTDQGAQHMELGLLIHKGDWRSARLWEAGYNFNTPFEVVRTGAHRGSLPATASLISVESDHVYLGAVKRADDDGDLIVRLIEATGQPGTVVVNIGQGRRIKAAVETDLLELNPAPLSPSGSILSVEMGPYQIRTFKLKIGK